MKRAAIKLMTVLLVLLDAPYAMAKECRELQTQADMNICEGKKLGAADAQLNAVYNKLTAKVSAAGKAKLIDAQRAWIKYRDLQCEFDAFGTNGGSINGSMVTQCVAEMSRAQTKILARQLNCEDTDPSCGGQ